MGGAYNHGRLISVGSLYPWAAYIRGGLISVWCLHPCRTNICRGACIRGGLYLWGAYIHGSLYPWGEVIPVGAYIRGGRAYIHRGLITGLIRGGL